MLQESSLSQVWEGRHRFVFGVYVKNEEPLRHRSLSSGTDVIRASGFSHSAAMLRLSSLNLQLLR